MFASVCPRAALQQTVTVWLQEQRLVIFWGKHGAEFGSLEQDVAIKKVLS